VKQDESDGDPKFIAAIGLGGKSMSYWKPDKKQSWKWRRVCRAYKNPISEFNVGQMNSKNKRKACGAHIVSNTRGGTTRHMDWGSS